jgi:hypothetical protein
MKKKIAYHESKLWDFIYPLYANLIVFGNDYESFAEVLAKDFDLTPRQWEAILIEYEFVHNRILSN